MSPLTLASRRDKDSLKRFNVWKSHAWRADEDGSGYSDICRNLSELEIDLLNHGRVAHGVVVRRAADLVVSGMQEVWWNWRHSGNAAAAVSV